MRIQSLIFDGHYHAPIEVELTLWPGLPCIQFLGLPDQHIKESAARIKSAIKSQGFEFPRSKQIYVNLRPNYLKKSSKGIELAVAVAYLLETGQIPAPEKLDQIFYFGELDLSGRVYFPKEKIKFQIPQGIQMVSSEMESQEVPMELSVIQSLRDLKKEYRFQLQQERLRSYQRPELDLNLRFSKKMARLLKICALGNHSILLAGASGTGKTTFAKSLYQLLPDPTVQEWKEILFQDQDANWRPLIKPHHTTPVMTLIGGGSKITKGEIARAHRGLLLLDEFLEFNPEVIEALREPMEEKKMRVARSGNVVEFPADCLIVGTTNLCPCGQWTPEVKMEKPCSYSAKRCHSKRNRLSGPILDRFEMLAFFHEVDQTDEAMGQILEDIQKSFLFRAVRKRQEQACDLSRLEFLIPDLRGSRRRKNATLGVARTIADLEQSDEVTTRHIREALEVTFFSFQQISYGGHS